MGDISSNDALLEQAQQIQHLNKLQSMEVVFLFMLFNVLKLQPKQLKLECP